jgi:hypothetical protein
VNEAWYVCIDCCVHGIAPLSAREATPSIGACCSLDVRVIPLERVVVRHCGHVGMMAAA